MRAPFRLHNHIVAALLTLLLGAPAYAQDAAKLDDLFTRLKQADAPAAARIESEILIEWEKSGSATIDALTRRGQTAREAGDFSRAVDHFSAAIDHDPQFLAVKVMRAASYKELGEIGPALADLAAVLQAEPRHFIAWALLGEIQSEVEELPRARAALRQAAAIHPHIAEVNAALTQLNRKLDGQEL